MSSRGESPRPGRETALAALFFLGVTVLMTWPQAVHLSDAISDVGDAKLNTRILQWDYHQTLHDPGRLYALNFFYPAQDVLAFSENLWGVSVFGFPLLSAGASPLANYNVLLLLGMFLSSLAAWALARHVTGDPAGALVAGVVFAFLPWRFSQLPHLQFQWAPFLALTLLFLLRYLEEGRRRDAVLLAVAFGWNALSNVHYALFGGVLVAVVLGVSGLQRVGDARRWRGAALATAAGALVFVPFALPYRRVEEHYGMKRYFGEVLTFSGRWTDFLSAGGTNRLYGGLTAAWRHAEGDLFPGLAALFLAGVAVATVRRPTAGGAAAPATPGRRRLVRALDAATLGTAALWLGTLARPGLRLGSLGLGDPGRVQVWATLLLLARLLVALPGHGRYASLGDWLRRGAWPPRLTLLVAVAGTGLVLALGGHSPYYRFLFQSFGQIFRAIRAPVRGIVLFHLALAVLAAWGLSLLRRRFPSGGRTALVAAALALVLFEYRAFPLALTPTPSAAPPVYAWLAAVEVPAAVVEWPLGLHYDFDYVFRQAQHGRPILNGYSGFFPKTYTDLEGALRQRPIPDTVWAQMGNLGAGVLVYHAHEGRGIQPLAYADALDRALASGGLALIRSFPHGEGVDFVFVGAASPWKDRLLAGVDSAAARALYAATVADRRAREALLSPPFGSLDSPAEGATVAPGDWGFGWALDDSGVAEVLVAADGGTPAPAIHPARRAGLGALYPEYPDAENGGFVFHVPDLAPGPHRLTVTFVARDGGRTSVTRSIRVRGAESAP